MTYALDVRTLALPRSGTGVYVEALAHELLSLTEPGELTLIGSRPTIDHYFSGLITPAIITDVPHDSHPMGDLWESLTLPGLLKKRGINLIHGPAYLAPLFPKRGIKTVTTIHDLVPYRLPDSIPQKYRVYMKTLLNGLAFTADQIIAISDATKQDIVEILNVDPARITVIPQGVSPRFTPPVDKAAVTDRVCRKYEIKGPYFLFVGNLEPRKNLPNAMAAFKQAVTTINDSQMQLVVVGKKGWVYDDIVTALDAEIDAGRVVHLDRIDDDAVVSLYQGATGFLFPTRYEGFGLPILEAQSCGVPVITSTISSAPEIAGSAALLVDPDDVDAIAAAIVTLATEEQHRASLITAGIENAKQYNWRATAKKTLACYHAVG